MKRIEIITEYIKLDSFMKLSGLAMTGGAAKEEILAGLVKVNGEVCLMRGKKLRPGDIVEAGGEKLEVAAGEG